MKRLLWICQMLWVGLAAAESTPAPGSGGLGGAMNPFIPLIIIFAIFYFLILRPQQKKNKQHQKFLSELKRGEMVITNSGIVGTIKNISDKFVTLEIDQGVCMKMLKSQVLEGANTLKDAKKDGTTATQTQE